MGFFLVLFLLWCDRGGNRLRSLRYVRYDRYATLRYRQKGTEERTTRVFCWCRVEREREREKEEEKREDKRDTPEKRRLSTKDREKYNPEKQNPERERRRRSRNGNNSIMLRNHSHHELPRSVPPQSISHKQIEKKRQKNLTSLFHNRHPPLPLPRLHHARSPTPGHPHADLPPQSHRLRTPLHNLRRPPIASNLHRLGPQRLQLARRPNISSMHQHALSTRKSEYPRSRLAYVAGSWRESEM